MRLLVLALGLLVLNAFAAKTTSIKLKVELAMAGNQKATETIVVPADQWVTRDIGTYLVKTKAIPDVEAVRVEMEMLEPETGKIKKSTIITRWDSSPAMLVLKDDEGKSGYRVSVVASKNNQAQD